MRRLPPTEKDKEKIIELYKKGYSYSDIQRETGFWYTAINRQVHGLRTPSEGMALARKQGKFQLTEPGRQRLSENGRQACQRSGKFYTKPERLFKQRLNEIGIGVRFPDYIKEIKKVEDDSHPYCLMYQFPVLGYVIDYADADRKIAININGDYWHANPVLYDQENLGKLQRVNVRQDGLKRNYLERNGWTVLDIWESEIYWNREVVAEKLRAVGVEAARMDYTHETGVQISHCPPDWSEILKRLWFKTDRKPRTKAALVESVCWCGNKFFHKSNLKRKSCSLACAKKKQQHHSKYPGKEELELFVNKVPISQIAKKYGVSVAAVKKWFRRCGIEWIKNIQPVFVETEKMKAYRIVENQRSRLRHQCKCGEYKKKWNAKQCRKCWLESKRRSENSEAKECPAGGIGETRQT